MSERINSPAPSLKFLDIIASSFSRVSARKVNAAVCLRALSRAERKASSVSVPSSNSAKASLSFRRGAFGFASVCCAKAPKGKATAGATRSGNRKANSPRLAALGPTTTPESFARNSLSAIGSILDKFGIGAGTVPERLICVGVSSVSDVSVSFSSAKVIKTRPSFVAASMTRFPSWDLRSCRTALSMTIFGIPRFLARIWIWLSGLPSPTVTIPAAGNSSDVVLGMTTISSGS